MKRKSSSILFEGKDVFAVNRRARKELKAKGIAHLAVPMFPLLRHEVRGANGKQTAVYFMGNEEFRAPQKVWKEKKY